MNGWQVFRLIAGIASLVESLRRFRRLGRQARS